MQVPRTGCYRERIVYASKIWMLCGLGGFGWLVGLFWFFETLFFIIDTEIYSGACSSSLGLRYFTGSLLDLGLMEGLSSGIPSSVVSVYSIYLLKP